MKKALAGYSSLFGGITEKELETIQAAGAEMLQNVLAMQGRAGYDDQNEKAATTRNSYGLKKV